MIKLSTKPNESGTIIITATFEDFDDVPFTPKTLKYSLTDTKGNVINSRNRIVVNPQGSTHVFVLSGLDLVYQVGSSYGERVFTIEGTYDSVYGGDLPFREEAWFEIVDTVVNSA